MKMKTLMMIIMMMMSGSAMALDACFTGSWYETDGQGINIEVLSADRTVGYWYGYGTDQHNRWYTFDLDSSGVGPIYTTDNSGQLFHVGDASLDAVDNDTVIFVTSIVVDVDNPPWCLGCERSQVMTRLTQPIECGD
jgi:hypothetical protein